MANVIQQVPESFAVLSGDDSMTLPLIALGGRGIISVASNEIPAEMTQLAQLCLKGDFAGARAVHRKYLALMEINFVESNPIPVKAAMGLMGLLDPVFRLPMCPPKPENLAKIEKVLESARTAGGPEGARCKLKSKSSSTRSPTTTPRIISRSSRNSRPR